MADRSSTDYRRHWQRFCLDNGLRVVISPDHATPIAAVNLWYDVGSRNELPGQHGFAHLFEHLMFEGSAHLTKGEHFATLTAVGATNVNATTDFERTNYYETVPVEHLELALWLEADRMATLDLTQATLDNQRDVVANERRQRYDNQPYGEWVEELLLLCFPDGHPYQHSVIGSMQDLAGAELAHFQRFNKIFYAPNNAVLTIVGDIEPEAGLELVDRYFGGIPTQPDLPRLPADALPPHLAGSERRTIVSAVPVPRFWAAFRTPPAGTREQEVLAVFATVMGAGRGCRLYRELVRNRQLAQPNGGFMGAWDLSGCPSLLAGSATARRGVDIAELEEAFFGVLDDALRGGFSEQELDRARAQITTGWLNQLSTVAGTADTLSGFTTRFDDPGRIDSQLDRLLSVTADELVDVAREVVGADRCRVLTFEPATPVEEVAA